MINEATVRSFLALVRTKSFTDAAKQLFLSQQAVSKHIAKLEEDLDCSLLIRERGNLALSEMGELYYKAFCEMETSLNTAREEARRRSDDQGNTLVIGHLELLDIYRFFKPFYREFQIQNPNIRISYKSTPDWTSIQWLLDGKVDVSFTFEQDLIGHEDELAFLEIDQFQEMLVVSKEHPQASDASSYLDFRNESVYYTPIPDHGKGRMMQRMKDIGFPPDHLVETDNILSSCSSVELLQGVTFLTDYCRMLESPTFCTFPTNQKATLVMAYKKRSPKRNLRRFVEFATQNGAIKRVIS